MALDIAMGGSTNTVLHILAIAHEAGVAFTMDDIDRLSRRVPNICKVAPSSQYHVEDVHRAGGIFTILGSWTRPASSTATRAPCTRPPWAPPSTRTTSGGRPRRPRPASARWPRPAASRRRSPSRRTSTSPTSTATPRAAASATSSTPTARTAAWRSCTATSPQDGCIVKTAGVDASILKFEGPARVFQSQEAACDADPGRPGSRRRRRRHRLRRPEGRPRHAGDAVPDVVLEGQGAGQGLRAHHRRPLLGRDRPGSASATSRPRRAKAAPSA